MIQIKNLTFSHPGAEKPIFDSVNLDLDTGWRLALIGRNGRGKTTFLKLLSGELRGRGSVVSSEKFEYFPLQVQDATLPALVVARAAIAPFDEWEQSMSRLTKIATSAALQEYGEIESRYAAEDGYTINSAIAAEVSRLGIGEDALHRPFSSLSGGEKVKLLLAALFLKKHHFLLIDEPTDHLDEEGRHTVARWMSGKSGFILVSHDRAFLDETVDHVLSINKASIELQKGNYSTWKCNRDRQDGYEIAQNKKLKNSIAGLTAAAKRTEKWGESVEKSKKQSKNVADQRAAVIDRGYIGHQSARMMQRSKAIQNRRAREMEEKQGLLENIEETEALFLQSLPADKPRLLTMQAVGLCYGEKQILKELDVTIDVGQRIAVVGANGCGKSSLLKLVTEELMPTSGGIRRYGGLVMSTLPQETDFLQGDIFDFAQKQGLDTTLFLAILRKLDFERAIFLQEMQHYSAGQKKKVCLAASLAKPAHLFVWDEPLNYIDILSREQIEKAVLQSGVTMLFVEHDATFVHNIATDCLRL